MTETLQSFAIGTLGLWVMLAVAIVLTAYRQPVTRDHWRSIQRLVWVGCGLHALHLTEELKAGFHERFPQLLGLAPWTPSLFLAFNLGWLILWSFGTLARAPHPIVLATFWFLALASALNGLAHPALAWATGGYFPGLWTSPLVGVFGVLLIRKLISSSVD